MLAAFMGATFLGAALLFAVQPLAAREVSPVFGGSPAVWNTSVMFFQTVLLLGYLYAHILTTRLAWRAQVVVHLAVLALALAIPLGMAGARVDSPTPGVWTLLALLAAGVGAQFFAVSSAGPLVQRWFAATGHWAGGDPYFLYAASNAGSFAGLLAYPFVIERVLPLQAQSQAWRIGLAVFALLMLACALRVWRAGGAPAGPLPRAHEPNPPRPRGRERLSWIFLAFVPASLMLGVTQYLSTDIAAVPLLWVVPLGLYLLTFVAAFSRAGDHVTAVAHRLWPFAAVAVVLAFLLDARHPLPMIVAVHLGALAVGGCLCHGRLRAMRPEVTRLTEFYLCLSLGGALAGVFHTFAAPVLFDDLHEYPLAIVLACAAMPLQPRETDAPRPAPERVLWLIPLALLALVVFGPRAHVVDADAPRSPLLLLSAGLPALVLFLASRRPGLFTATAAAVLLAVALRGDGSRLEFRERTFYGIHSVRIDPSGRYRILGHGTTIHGMEALAPDRRGEPLAYYHVAGPAGQVFGRLGETFESVGLIGLGAGSMAAYARPGQRFDFFEIDPTVVAVASNPEWFTFLHGSEGDVRVIVGDGRIRLASQPEADYDCIVLDAFSSDSVPVHLLTQEAVALYASRLRPGGVLLFHLSNRYLDLAPYAAAAAESLGMACLERQDQMTAGQAVESGRHGSRWLLATADPETIASFRRDVRWVPSRPADRPWTDAHADIVGALSADPSTDYGPLPGPPPG